MAKWPDVRGVGPRKLAEYGRDVLTIVRVAGTGRTDTADDPPIRPPEPGPASAAPDPTRSASSEDSTLFEALREWRAAMARRDQVPAYVISRNETLEEITRLRPKTEAELLVVRGIGPERLARYGDDILELVKSNPPG